MSGNRHISLRDKNGQYWDEAYDEPDFPVDAPMHLRNRTRQKGGFILIAEKNRGKWCRVLFRSGYDKKSIEGILSGVDFNYGVISLLVSVDGNLFTDVLDVRTITQMRFKGSHRVGETIVREDD